MNRQILGVVDIAIFALLILEGLFWGYGGWALYQLYSSQNVGMDYTPVWVDALLCGAHLVLAVVYIANLLNCRRWFAGPALLALLVGFYFVSKGFAGVHWSLHGIMHGELIEMGALSSIGYLVLGLLGLSTTLFRRRLASD